MFLLQITNEPGASILAANGNISDFIILTDLPPKSEKKTVQNKLVLSEALDAVKSAASTPTPPITLIMRYSSFQILYAVRFNYIS